MKQIISLFIVLYFCFTANVMAQQTHGGGPGGDDLKGVCGMASGTWRTSTNGWACCWADWGCYGCVNNHCEMKCHTERCKKANGMARPSSSQQAVPGLAPTGKKPPIIPMQKTNSSATLME